MASLDWQTVAALAVVAAALLYLGVVIRRTFAGRKNSTGCGSCGSCPKTPSQDGFVALEKLTPRRS